MADVEHKVLKYKSYLETNENGNKVLYIFTRLTEMLITIDILQRTGIGKVVNSFRKKDGEIGQLAKDIVARWKSMVTQRLEAEAEAQETTNQVDDESESGLESERDDSSDEDFQSGNETKEEIRESENKQDNGDKCSSDVEKRKLCSKSDDKAKVAPVNVQRESKSDQVKTHRIKEKDHQSKKPEEHKQKASDSKHNSSDSKHTASDSKHTSSDSKHTSSDSKHKSSDSKHTTSESKHKSSDSKHTTSESKHKSSDSKHTTSESKHKSSDSKHTTSESKHKSSDSKHTSSDSKHKTSESKLTSSDSKHNTSEIKHTSSDSKHSSSENKQKSSEKKHNSLESKNKTEEKKHKTEEGQYKREKEEKEVKTFAKKPDASERSHKGSSKDDRPSNTDRHSKQRDVAPAKEQGQKGHKEKYSHKMNPDTDPKVKSLEKRNGNSKSDLSEKLDDVRKSSGQPKTSLSEKKVISEKSENDRHQVKSETSKSVISSLGTPASSGFNEKAESTVDSDHDPLHWEMLESFEQEKPSISKKSVHKLPHHEQFNEDKNRLSEEKWTEQKLKSEENSHSVLCDPQKSIDCEKKHVSKVLMTSEREHSKDRESKHKHREKSFKSRPSEEKECSMEKHKHREKSSKPRPSEEKEWDKQHRDDSGHKNKHSKHKHKHSDKEKEHKHSKPDTKSEKREVIQEKKDSEKRTYKKEDLVTEGQGKERERSSILESLSNEVDEGKFISDDLPGLWFLNSNNNSFIDSKSDTESSKLKMPCGSSEVKVDSPASDKNKDYAVSSEKSFTSENDKKDKKRHKHSKDRESSSSKHKTHKDSKDRESSSSKHKSHKDSKDRHDSKHHRDKKRKHSGDADDSKPSKSRRKSSQDGMSFEDLLTAGASEAKQSQPSKLSQNDYAQLKSKFKVKKKENNSTKGGRELQIQVTEDEVLGALPQPNTHYRPWRLKEVEEKKKTDEELLDEFIASTKTTGRTQMYSGKKQNFVPEVYKLYDMCMTVLCNNIDSLEFVGGVPFSILKPVLEKCTAAQLYRLEDFNPHFLDESDSLWMNHCHKEFRLSKPEELETWREHYLRKFDEREEKLKKISANINASIAKKVPERKTQLAYIDSAAKPPRSVRRQQARYGTAGPSSGERSRARFLPSMDPIPIGRSNAGKTSAPMMAKTLSMIKKMRH